MVTIIEPTVLLKLSERHWTFNRWIDHRRDDSIEYWDNCFKATDRLTDKILDGRTIISIEVIRKGQV